MRLVKKRRIKIPPKVYNLHVKNNHNYIANGAVVSNCHQAKARTINEMLTGPGANVPFRFGCTGTLPKEEIFRFQIEACIGKQIFVLRTWQLQHLGVLADTIVYQIRLNDFGNPAYQKRIDYNPFEDWSDELDWLMMNPERLDYIAETLSKVRDDYGNTLVLVPFRKHGKALQERLDGSVSLDGRDRNRSVHYKHFNETDDNILICTYGIASTGLDIPRVHNLSMLEPGKKFEKVIQTLGRGLRKADDKHTLNVFDICSNHGISGSHSKKRIKLFREAKQHIEIIEAKYYDDTDS